MLKVTDFVMWFAPAGVFGAVAAAITVQGIGILATYGKFIGSFYAALLVLWMVLIVPASRSWAGASSISWA
jgi:Na+/H+-dicarboxylate symporter